MAVKQARQQRQSTSKNQRRFRMRPIEVLDADVVAGWYQQIEDVSIFDRQLPLPINHSEVIALVKSLAADQEKEKCRWFIAETMEGEAVGMAGLEAINLLHGNAIMPVFIAERTEMICLRPVTGSETCGSFGPILTTSGNRRVGPRRGISIAPANRCP